VNSRFAVGETQVFGATRVYRYSGPKHRGREVRGLAGGEAHREAAVPPPVALSLLAKERRRR
jgi:hypothetical protein